MSAIAWVMFHPTPPLKPKWGKAGNPGKAPPAAVNAGQATAACQYTLGTSSGRCESLQSTGAPVVVRLPCTAQELDASPAASGTLSASRHFRRSAASAGPPAKRPLGGSSSGSDGGEPEPPSSSASFSAPTRLRSSVRASLSAILPMMAWRTLKRSTECHGSHGSGRRPVRRYSSGSSAADRDKGVDALGVRFEHGPRLRGHGRDLGARGGAERERAEEPVVLDAGRAGDFGPPALAAEPVPLHLPQAVTRAGAAHRKPCVVLVRGLDVGDAERVAADRRRGPQAGGLRLDLLHANQGSRN